MIGIYTITNTINNKIYVGYSKNLHKRRNYHLNALLIGKHSNINIIKDLILLGKDCFKFEILTECEEQFLASEEHYWATTLNVHNPLYGYNIKLTHPDNIHIHLQETKDKISKAHLGKKLSKEHRNKISERMKGKSFFSGKHHTEEVKTKLSTLYKGKKLPEVTKNKISLSLKGKPVSERKLKNLNKIKERQKKPVEQLFEGIKINEFKSLAEAEHNTKISRYNISACCNKRLKHAGGYIWQFKE